MTGDGSEREDGRTRVSLTRRTAAHAQIERALALPMLLLSLGFIVVLVWPIANPHLSVRTRDALDAADWGAWAAFAIEYAALLATAPDWRRFFRTHLLDLAVVLLPLLRPLRIARAARVMRVLRLARLAAVIIRSARVYRTAFLSKAVVFVLMIGSMVGLASAVVVLDVERDRPTANIRTFGDALWWAVTTSTRVGNSDRYPVTAAGRAVGAVLALAGVAVLGVVTASLTAWLVSLTTEAPTDAGRDAELRRISDQLAALRASVDELRERGGVGSRPD